MTKALTILAKDKSIAEWMDFNLLRQEGIRHISGLSGDVWTDHNLHDPGITILDVLCYALTDLGYRANLSVADLLARDPNTLTKPDDNFFSPAQLLSCNPLTVADYRKMLMNIEGVRNAWLEPASCEETRLPLQTASDDKRCNVVYLVGLHKVILELDVFLDGKTLWEQEGKVDAILKQATAMLHSHRNLCEDFSDIFVLRDEEISIQAEIEIHPDASPDEVTVAMMTALQNFLSPQIRYYTLREMLDRKKTMDDIFLGRPFDAALQPENTDGRGQAPNYGFIDPAELEAIERKTILYASDFYRVIMQTEGIRAVRSLRMFNHLGGLEQTTGEDWCLQLTPRHRPVMSPWSSSLRLFKTTIEAPYDRRKTTRHFRDRISGLAKTLVPGADLDSAYPQGTHRPDLGEFRSIQHEFPMLYRVGKDELPSNAPEKLKTKKQQLKGYLLFFDQILANYLAQLQHLRSLFSLGPNGKGASNEKPNGGLTTQFSQPLADAPELETLLRSVNMESLSFIKGEVMAEPAETLHFATQEQRELAIRRMRSDFEEGKIRLVLEKPEPLVNDKCRFLVVSTANGATEIANKNSFDTSAQAVEAAVFISKKTFGNAFEATQAAETLHLLGTLAGCYKLVTRAENPDKPYTFQLVYQPLPYADHLGQLTEKPDSAENHRTRLLNHLLGRFAEEFTDYTLLMYALEGKKRDERKIIRDKEAFLTDYPVISRDRGRAFNYLTGGEGNISGMERRVARLMGLQEPKNRALSNLEISTWEPLYFAVVKNTRGEVIFQGVREFPTEAASEAEAKQIINEWAKNKDNYRVNLCRSTGVYTLHLEAPAPDPAHCPPHTSYLIPHTSIIALHPLTYPTSEQVDRKIQCLLRRAGKKKGYSIEVVPQPEGGWFKLLDDSGKPLLESVQPTPDLKTARRGWLELVDMFDRKMLAKESSPFKEHKDELTRNFTFYLGDGGYSQRLANASATFCTRRKREAAMQDLENYLSGKTLRPRLVVHPKSFSWQLHEPGSEKKKPLLVSIPRFESQAQAQANFDWFRQMASAPEHWHDLPDEHRGEHGFFVREQDGYSAANSPWFKTKEERSEAKEKAQEIAALEYSLYQHPEQFHFILVGKSGKELLSGRQVYDSKEEAQWAFYEFSEKAAETANYRIEREPGSCHHTIFIPGTDAEPEAVHPVLYDNFAAAMQVRDEIVAFVRENRLHFEAGYAEKTWLPEIHWENHEGWCAPLFVGVEPLEQEQEAKKEAMRWAEQLRQHPESLQKTERDGCFSFKLLLETGGKTAARHPVKYAEAGVRDKIMSSVPDFFDGPKGWTGSVEAPLVNPSDGIQNYGFRLAEKGTHLAQHPAIYSKKEKRDKAFHHLLKLGKGNALPYSTPLPASESTLPTPAGWRFEIKDPQRVWWQSEETFPTKEEAVAGFETSFRSLLDWAENPCRYEVQKQSDCRWNVSLTNEAGAIVARIPGRFHHPEDAYCAKNERIELAKSYPLRREGQAWHFRILSITTEEDTVLWRSSGTWASLPDAQKAFDHFLRLAAKAGNYFKKDNACAGRFGIELREVLLESTHRNYEEEKAAWIAADGFSFRTGQEGAFYPFANPQDPCRYGFRVVSESYVVARHSRRFRTAAEREDALHRLHAENRRNVTGRTVPIAEYERTGSQFFLKVTINGVHAWNGIQGFPLGPDSDLQQHIRLYYEGDEKIDLPEYMNYIQDLYEYARCPEFYLIVREKEKSYRLGLTNPDAGLELSSEQTFETEEACRAEAREMIRRMRRYPVLKEDGKFRFQYFSFDEDWTEGEQVLATNGIVFGGKILWESAFAYDTPGKADDAFDEFIELVKDKTNYQRSQEHGDRYFSVEITDPAQALAEHPLTYPDQSELQAAIATATAALEGEGFRLVEHILLRPDLNRKQEDVYIAYGTPTGEEGEAYTCLPYPFSEEEYGIRKAECPVAASGGGDAELPAVLPGSPTTAHLLPYADAYSFRMTAVLPCWPRRFQQGEFRKFFENTLRRETPAHIWLDIAWVNPSQMRLFETKYQAWANARTLEGDCLRGSTQDAFLLYLFEEMEQGNPPANLDAEDSSGEIELDRTFLTD